MAIASVRAGLHYYLSSNAPLTALVGTRIYAERLPDEVSMPALLFTQVSGTPEQAFSGLTGAVEGRFQFDIYAAAEAQETIEQIREALMNLTTGYQSLTLGNGDTFELLNLAPFDYGRYLPDPDTQGLRYTIDFIVMFGRS